MLLSKQRPHCPSAIFHTIYYSIMEQDVSIYSVPPAHKRNTEMEDSCVDLKKCLQCAAHLHLLTSFSTTFLLHYNSITKNSLYEQLTIPLEVYEGTTMKGNFLKRILNKTKIIKLNS